MLTLKTIRSHSFSDDDVEYEVFAKVLDATKFLNEDDPKEITQPEQGWETKKTNKVAIPKSYNGKCNAVSMF